MIGPAVTRGSGSVRGVARHRVRGGSWLVVACTACGPSTHGDTRAPAQQVAVATDDHVAEGCSDAAPAAWIACQDFDAIDDPRLQLAEWLVFDDGFAIEPDRSHGAEAGDRVLRVTRAAHVSFGGWVTLRVGAGPEPAGRAESVAAADRRFDELWVRYRVRTDDDWGGDAPGDLGEVIAMDPARWAIAAEVAIRSEAAALLEPLGWSCIDAEGRLGCDGRNDWRGGLQRLWARRGSTPWFDAAHVGRWRCVEAFVRLDRPGLDDGEARVWVDGELQIAVTDIRFRGSWSAAGWNALRFTNHGEPSDRRLSFFVDDVVFATQRVGC